MPNATAFDLVLAFPQWQGSGRPQHLPRGAAAAAAACAAFGPRVDVPLAGEGEARDGVHRFTAIVEQLQSAQALLRAHAPARVLTAGGDCACDVAVIDHLHRAHPDLVVLWVDAHLDANTPATSPSGSFHGMPVAALTGAAPPSLRPWLGAPLDPARVRYVGAHVGDDGEWAYQRERGIAWCDPEAPALPEGPVHVHFDLDALDPAEFPHVAYPEGRLPLAAARRLLHRVAGGGRLVGLTITEFAPVDAMAAEDGSRVIARLCEAALGR